MSFLLYHKDLDKAYKLVGDLLVKAKGINKRHFDSLNASIFFYYSRTRELKGQLLDIRVELIEAYRTATLRHDEFG